MIYGTGPEHCLLETLHSIALQSARPSEVIVARCHPISLPFEVRNQLPEIRFLDSRNRSSIQAFNLGLSIVETDHVQLLRSGELLHPRGLEAKLEAGTPGTIVCNPWLTTNREGFSLIHDPDWNGDTFSDLVFEEAPLSAPLFSTRDLIELGGFDESQPLTFTEDLLFRLVAHGKTFTKAGNRAFVRLPPTPLFGRGLARYLVSRGQLYQRVAELFTRIGEFTPARRRQVQRRLLSDSSKLIKLGYPLLAFRLIQVGLSLFPPTKGSAYPDSRPLERTHTFPEKRWNEGEPFF